MTHESKGGAAAGWVGAAAGSGGAAAGSVGAAAGSVGAAAGSVESLLIVIRVGCHAHMTPYHGGTPYGADLAFDSDKGKQEMIRDRRE